VQPSLTIGIPTQGKRPERLLKAIGSALEQTEPAVVLVADQGGGAAETLKAYHGHPLVRRVETDADGLWANWTAAVEACDTPLFAWLQDDDALARHFARRVRSAFDRFPDAQSWIARLTISRVPGLGNWWEATGPPLPADCLDGNPNTFDGGLFAIGAYFTSFALSPGVAFRINDRTLEAVRNVPKDADLFAERSILAELGRLSDFIYDPAVCGYWVHHEGNESRRLNALGDGERERQFNVMCGHVDALIAENAKWPHLARSLFVMAGPDAVRHYLRATIGHDHRSPYLKELRELARAVYPGMPADPAPKAEPEPEPATAEAA
jgi:hypothetical protein